MNGGGRCYVVNLGKGGTVAGDARKGTGIHALNAYDEPSMILAPGCTEPADYRALIDHAEAHEDRVAILDAPARVDDVKDLTEVATAEPAPAGAPEEPAAARPRGAAPRSKSRGAPKSNYAAIYYPWLVIADPFNEGKLVEVPPSGHMAGIYAMNDVRRGVHKAPANYPVRTAINLTRRVTHEEQGVLNDAGINCIRFFRDGGIRVWGARTRAEDPQWRYINVRRLFNMIKETIEEGSNWVVFEPNDTSTRNAVAFNCRAFLTLQWRAGALVGDTPEQAFFVKCDAENNPPEVVDAGRLIIDIGMAPSKPAEFIIFRVSQWRGGTEAQVAA
jgi:phage tail sheath protein FI